MMARLPLPAFSSYTASKHALRGFLNTLAVEEREQGTGVRIAMIEPGPLDTPIYGRATSATGRSPARLFDAYHPDEIAKAIERAVDRPRREHVVGGESKLMTVLYETARPVGEVALLFVDRWYRLGGEPTSGPGSLWEGNDRARIGDGHPARRSGDVVSFARNMLPRRPAGRLRSARRCCAPCPRSSRAAGRVSEDERNRSYVGLRAVRNPVPFRIRRRAAALSSARAG